MMSELGPGNGEPNLGYEDENTTGSTGDDKNPNTDEGTTEVKNGVYDDFSISTSVVYPSYSSNNINSITTSSEKPGHAVRKLSFCRNLLERINLLQATVFIEDAAKYRDVCHKVDKTALQLYRMYHSQALEWTRHTVIFILHILAFFEYPSSLTWTSDIRYRGDRIEIPCGVTEGIEVLCLLFLLADVMLKYWLIGRTQFFKKKWMIATVVVVLISMIDWGVSLGLKCNETTRFRRIIRPFFIIVHSNLMKKTVKCLQRTLPEVISVLLLLALHLYIFTLIGMLLFPKPKSASDGNNSTDGTGTLFGGHYLTNNTTPTPNNQTDVSEEGDTYFRTLSDAFMSLLVLLTTANNPDVMMPVYKNNRFYSLYFIVFLLIGNYCFMNMFLAVIYNQFRGYFQTSMQSSLLRRRVGVRAAYEVMKSEDKYSDISGTGDSSASNKFGVSLYNVKTVVEHADLPHHVKAALRENLEKRVSQSLAADHLTRHEFQQCFEVLETEKYVRHKPPVRWFSNPHLRRIQRCIAHRFYNYFGNLVALANVVLISVELSTEYDKILYDSKSELSIANFVFIMYYVIEQIVKLVGLGWRRYLYERANIFDGIITLALLITEIFTLVDYGFFVSENAEVHNSLTIWNVVRIINILIMFRLLRIIPHIKAMSIVANTLVDLVKNLKSFAGILVVIYYSFAVIGIEIFHDSIQYTPANVTDDSGLQYECGTYQQLEYWANNFDDFFAAIVVLWDVMVVNNWSIFLKAYAKATTQWSYIYFVIWWLFSVVIVMQLFTALIIENFIMKWDKSTAPASAERGRCNSEFEESHHFMSVHDMFREKLQEPSEEQIMLEISNNRYLQKLS